MKTDKSDVQTLVTVNGKITYSRYVLRPTEQEKRRALKKKTGTRSVVPLDDLLGVSKLPFKITPQAMTMIAFWGQNQPSYQRAEEALERIGMCVKRTKRDTIRNKRPKRRIIYMA